MLDALYPHVSREGERLPYEKLGDRQRQQVEILDQLQESVYQPVEWQEMSQLTVDWLKLAREGGDLAVELAGIFAPIPNVLKLAQTALTGAAYRRRGCHTARYSQILSPTTRVHGTV